MNLEYYIAKRIHFGKDKANRFSSPAIGIAISSIAVGIAVMLIAIMIIIGFKSSITETVVSFGAHIRITNFDNNSSFESIPIRYDSALVQKIKHVPGVKSVHRYATKPGILKTKDDFQGIVIKGLSADFGDDYFRKNIDQGKMFHFDPSKRNDSVVISASLSKLLNLQVNDPIDAYFFQDNIKVRRFRVCGIYETNFPEFDQLFMFADIRHINSLNEWDEDEVSGYEVIVDGFDYLDEAANDIFLLTQAEMSANSSLLTRSIKEVYPDIFSWLGMLDVNVWIILSLITLVAGFNMISGVLILILEKANMVGIVKALGMKDWSIRKVFLYQAAFLTGRGMLFGNIIALIFYFVQSQYGLFTLDPTNYYVYEVPVKLKLMHLLMLNAGTLTIIVLMMIIPSILIKKISVTRVINYE